jgi:hypothetical protein
MALNDIIVAKVNADGDFTETVLTAGDLKLGTTANLPIKTGTNGVIEAGSFGSSAGQFAEGNHAHEISTLSLNDPPAFLETLGGVAEGDPRLSDSRTPTSHTHGNLSNAGAIGTTANLPLKTGTNGVIEAGSFGTAAGSFCEGNDARLSDARTPLSHVHAAADVTSGTFDNARINFAAPPAIGSTTPAAGTFTTLTANTSLTLNGTGAAELVNSTSAAGPLRIYNTFTSGTNHERGFLCWSSNVFQIGTEKGSGGGTARALEFQTDGVTRMTVGTNGNVGIGIAGPSHPLQVIGSCDALAVGPIVATAVAGSNIGTALTLSATPLAGGRAYSFISTGPTALGGAGDFAVYGSGGASTAGYVFRANATGQYIAGFSQTSYLGQISVYPINASAKGVVIRGFASQTANLLECQNSSATVLASISAAGAATFAGLTLAGNLDASTRDIVTDTTTGTKIGTATSQKIGFFNATPVVQQAAVADATDAASTQARLNDLLARLRTLGLIAT